MSRKIGKNFFEMFVVRKFIFRFKCIIEVFFVVFYVYYVFIEKGSCKLVS